MNRTVDKGLPFKDTLHTHTSYSPDVTVSRSHLKMNRMSSFCHLELWHMCGWSKNTNLHPEFICTGFVFSKFKGKVFHSVSFDAEIHPTTSIGN